MILAIVGSRHVPNERMAVRLIHAAISGFAPELVISGGADGIDTMVRTVCRRGAVDFQPNGFKARNVAIAAECDVLVCIRSRTSGSYGSGWTADEAERRGKSVYRWEMP